MGGEGIKAHFTSTADMDVAEIYKSVIEDVVSKMAAEFENESVPDKVLQDLKTVRNGLGARQKRVRSPFPPRSGRRSSHNLVFFLH